MPRIHLGRPDKLPAQRQVIIFIENLFKVELCWPRRPKVAWKLLIWLWSSSSQNTKMVSTCLLCSGIKKEFRFWTVYLSRRGIFCCFWSQLSFEVLSLCITCHRIPFRCSNCSFPHFTLSGRKDFHSRHPIQLFLSFRQDYWLSSGFGRCSSCPSFYHWPCQCRIFWGTDYS